MREVRTGCGEVATGATRVWWVRLALAAIAVGLLPLAAAQSGTERYDVSRAGDVVTLSDKQSDTVVRVLTTASNAYQMTVKGHDVIRKTWNTLEDIRPRMGLNGVPLLWPYANRLEEQAFYANGRKYSFDPGLGNTGTNPIPIHGFLTTADAWKLVEAKADAKSAWVTMKLDFFRIPRYMKQFPFAHTLTMTYRVQDGALEMRTRIDSLSDEPIPVAIGFHPYFQLTDSPREEWRLSVAAKTHWLLDANKLPTGQTQPITRHPARSEERARERRHARRHLHGPRARRRRPRHDDADRQDAAARRGRRPALQDHARAVARQQRQSPGGDGAEGTVAFEPMAAMTNALHLAHKGVYKELQSIEPGGSWEESFWIRPRGF